VIRPRLRCHGSGRWHSDALALAGREQEAPNATVTGGDHVVGRAGAVEQVGDLEWVNDEGGAVGCAPLACMLPLSVGERRPRVRKPL
jgi:hypothetical protein